MARANLTQIDTPLATNQKRAGSLADSVLTLGFTRKGALAVEVKRRSARAGCLGSA